MVRKKDRFAVRTAAVLAAAFALFFSGCGETASSAEEAVEEAAEEATVSAEDTAAQQTEAVASADAAETESAPAQTEKAEAAREDGTLTVTFLDVGQGNAVLAEQDGHFMLIDGGDRDASSYVVSYLKNQGVETLEYVISSHYDADHLNGVVGALNAFSCDLLLDADYTADTKVYASLQSVIEEKEIAEVHPDLGDTYSFGDAEFTIVCPDAYDYDDENDNSVGIRLVYGDTSFLILGDAGEEAEAMMQLSGLGIKSDVYLASHHGSAYSSSLSFLQAVAPEAVVISAGLSNSYGHPAKTTLEHIRLVGAALYRTDLQGEIIATSDGQDIAFNVAATDDFQSGDEIAAAENGGSGTAENTQTGETQTAEMQDAAQDGQTETAQQETQTYILNTNTKKFHKPDCSSVERMSEANKASFTGTRDELIAAGYAACKNCNP